MSRPILSRFANHKFFRTVDLQPKGSLPKNRQAPKGTLVGGANITVYETDHRQDGAGVVYAFSVAAGSPYFIGHVNFKIDDKTQECVGLSGLCHGGKTTLPFYETPTGDPRQPQAEALCAKFLEALRNIYSDRDLKVLIQDTVEEGIGVFSNPQRVVASIP